MFNFSCKETGSHQYILKLVDAEQTEKSVVFLGFIKQDTGQTAAPKFGETDRQTRGVRADQGWGRKT